MPTVNTTSGSTSNGGGQLPPKTFRYKFVGKNDLTGISESEILTDIALRISDGRRLIIPIGLPNSGKSMFIASLIAYAFRRDKAEDNSCNFTNDIDEKYSGVKDITDALDNNTVLPSTRANEFSIIDINMKSRYRQPEIRISLLDFAGEDIERITGRNPDDPQGTAKKIERILEACIAQRAIFAILTPVNVNMRRVGELEDFDRIEDSEMRAFIDKIKVNNQRLYQRTKFLMVVTKWDMLPNKITAESFIKKHRNQLYLEYSDNSKSYGLLPYSVGDVVGKTIIRIVLRSPKNFWYTLYRWCTGIHVLPWWKRIFS